MFFQQNVELILIALWLLQLICNLDLQYFSRNDNHQYCYVDYIQMKKLRTFFNMVIAFFIYIFYLNLQLQVVIWFCSIGDRVWPLLIHTQHFLLILDEASEDNSFSQDSNSFEAEESKLPLQLAIVGRPNVGKSTLLNTLLQEDRVMVGPEAGLTRDSVRAEFEFQGRTIYLVNAVFYLYLFPLLSIQKCLIHFFQVKTEQNSYIY